MALDVSLNSESTDYMSGSIKWSGLSSGVDFSSVVDQLIKIERTNVNRLEAWKQEWVDKTKSITALNTRMVSLKLNAKDLDSYSEFYSRSSSSSNSSVITTTNTSLAKTGSHIIEVGQNIQGQVASLSYDDTSAIGGDDATDFVITIGSSAVTLTGGVDFNSADSIYDLASAINAKDDAGSDILQAEVVADKTRGSADYVRLIITANNGGSSNSVVVSDPTNLNFDENSIDPVFLKTWLGSTSTPTAGGTYTGSTNKTFTFAVGNTGVLGDDDVTMNWADNEGNSGSFTINAADWTDTKDYEVFQGVTVRFGAGRLIEAESFTIDAYNPNLQHAQDKGLAQAEKKVHNGFIDLITPVHTGGTAEFVYRYEGVETTVNVESGATLQALADAINNDENNRGVTATIIDDGQGTSTSYHLVLTGKETGAEHTIEFVASANPLSNFVVDDTTFSTAQKASDSMIKLDGFPTESYKYIQRSSNTVSDIADGLVIDIHDVGVSTVTVSDDVTAIKDKIKQLVNSVNFVLDFIRDETKFVKNSDDTTESGVMIGNYTYDIVRNSINQILYESVPGLEIGTDTYSHLSQIGIKTDPDLNGQWVVDENELDAALKNDLEAVARLFVNDPDHGSTGSQGIAYSLTTKMTELTDDESGIANVLTENYNKIIDDIDNKIASEERRIKMVKDRLDAQFARLESTLNTLQGQSTYLESQIAKLPKVGS